MQKCNYVLGYENIKIYQDSKYFNFSLDSILLPNFVRVKKTVKKILDIGSGNAIIPILLSLKFDASITGIELQKEIYELGLKSIKENKKEIKFIHADIKDYYLKQESDVYDLITCNPPYFTVDENAKLNEIKEKSIARHELTLTIEDICKVSKKLLKNKGSLCIVHRPERFLEIIDIMRKHNLEPKRVKFIYPKQDKEANMMLIEAIKDGKKGLKIESPLYIYTKENTYTQEVMKYFS